MESSRMTDLLLTMSSVCVRRVSPSLQVLGPFSLELRCGERLMITGPSGCGKTTLLRLAAGLEAPYSGTVTRAEGIRLAYVFQEPRLLPWYRVLDNILLPLFAAGTADSEARKQALFWLDCVGLADKADAWPLTLSGGMAQRVNLARAMALQPDILLLDEPFASLEAQGRLAMLALTAEHASRMGILHVTHHPEETADHVTATLRL